MNKLDLSQVNWDYALPMYLDQRFLQGKWGKCPLPECTGSDTFKVYGHHDKPKGKWKCCKCNEGGDYISLIHLVTGKSYRDLFAELESGNYNGGAPIRTAKPINLKQIGANDKSPEQKRRELQTAWDGSIPVSEDSPVWIYLTSRIPGLEISWIGPDIRFHPGMEFFHREQAESGDMVTRSKGKYPVMLQRVVSSERVAKTLQRLFLTPDGKKVPFVDDRGRSCAKKQMSSPTGPAGGSIRLNNAKSRTLALSEGAETGFAVVAKYMNRIEVRSLLDCGNLGRADIDWTQYDKVFIYADRDKIDRRQNVRPGEHHANLLAQKLRALGKVVRVIFPVEEGVDFCDIWARQYARLQRKRAHAEERRLARSGSTNCNSPASRLAA